MRRVTIVAVFKDKAPDAEWYTEVQRDGKAVLHVMTDYYIDAVLEATRAEDIEPEIANRGVDKAQCNGDL